MALGLAVAARYAAKKSALSVAIRSRAVRLKVCTWTGPAKFSIFLKSTPRKGGVKVRKRAQSILVIEKERRGWTFLFAMVPGPTSVQRWIAATTLRFLYVALPRALSNFYAMVVHNRFALRWSVFSIAITVRLIRASNSIPGRRWACT